MEGSKATIIELGELQRHVIDYIPKECAHVQSHLSESLLCRIMFDVGPYLEIYHFLLKWLSSYEQIYMFDAVCMNMAMKLYECNCLKV